MNLSLEFSKFNLYPFPVLAMDEDGFVVYKNTAVSKLYTNIRIGAKMSNYTNTNFSQGINSGTFYGENCLLFTTNAEGITIIFVILPFTSTAFANLSSDKTITEQFEKALLEYNETLDEKSQKAYLKTCLNNLEKATRFGEFAINFANNNLIPENVNASVALKEIIDVIANRLLDNVKIELCSETRKTNLHTNRKIFLIVVLSTLYFCVANSQSGDIKISLFDDEVDLHIAFEFTNGCNFNKLFADNSDFSKNPYMLTLTTALQFAHSSNVGLNVHSEPFKNTLRHKFEYVFKNCTYPEFAMSGKAIFTQDAETFINALTSIFSK